MERSYFEVKVSFIHVAVLLVGVILIGSFLFYLGYQAGKSSEKGGDKSQQQTELTGGNNRAEEIQLADVGSKRKNKKKDSPRKKTSIQDELKMHQLPAENTNSSANNQETVKTKPIKKSAYYSIQVGAFSDYVNAKNYSSKFANMGYPTEILSTIRGSKKLFRVRVGNFDSREKARAEMKKLEKMEKKPFAVVSPGQK